MNSTHAGDIYGYWVVLADVIKKSGRAYVSCKCDCGTVKHVNVRNLLSGISRSCGCRLSDGRLRKFYPDLQIGQKFGFLTVVSGKVNTKGRSRYLCSCSCGSVKEYSKHNLLRHHTKRCNECSGNPNRTPDYLKSLSYSSWLAMMRRCYNENSTQYGWYGWRGIKVCDRWHLFSEFLIDMGEKPSKKHTLDRINNDGNYEPGNCRWVTQLEQSRNRRNTIYITYLGITKPLVEWAEIFGIKSGTVYNRIVHGWDEVQALITPINKRYTHK